MPTNPFQTDGNQTDDEQEEEIEDDRSEAYDEDNDDQENASKTQRAKGELLAFLKDWLGDNQFIIWETPPNEKEGITGTKNKDNEAANPEIFKVYFNIDAILRKTINDNSDIVKTYKDLQARVSPWVNKGKQDTSNNYQDHGEIELLDYFIKALERAGEEEYQDRKDDLTRTIDRIKDFIRSHLVNWKERLEPLIPKDENTQKENALADLLAWEKGLIKEYKDWLTANKRFNEIGDAIDLNKKEQNLIRGIIKQTEQAIKTKKPEQHRKYLDNLRIKTGQAIELTIPDPDEVIPDEPKYTHYKQLITLINEGSNLFKKWSDILISIGKPNQQAEEAKKFIRLIDIALRADNYTNYKRFCQEAKNIRVAEEIKPFETCTTGGGTDCLNHPEGGNWLEAWRKAQGRLKGLEKGKEKQREAKERPPCDCLHCTHGLGGWTWISCPFYDNSIFKDKEQGKLGTVMGPDNAPHWVPPEGWTPFYHSNGEPRESKINNRQNNKIHKDVPFKYKPRWEHGGEDTLTGGSRPDKGKAPEKPKEPIFNFPSSTYEPEARTRPDQTTYETEPGADEEIDLS